MCVPPFGNSPFEFRNTINTNKNEINHWDSKAGEVGDFPNTGFRAKGGVVGGVRKYRKVPTELQTRGGELKK